MGSKSNEGPIFHRLGETPDMSPELFPFVMLVTKWETTRGWGKSAWKKKELYTTVTTIVIHGLATVAVVSK